MATNVRYGHKARSFPSAPIDVPDDDPFHTSPHRPRRNGDAVKQTTPRANNPFREKPRETPTPKLQIKTSSTTPSITPNSRPNVNVNNALDFDDFEQYVLGGTEVGKASHIATRPNSPEKGVYSVVGTPCSRSSVIERAFSELHLSSPDSSPAPSPVHLRPRAQEPKASQTSRVIVIGDSDDSEEEFDGTRFPLLDVESDSLVPPPVPADSMPSTRPPSLYETQDTTNDSSLGSMNSLFPAQSAASSISSIGSMDRKSDLTAKPFPRPFSTRAEDRHSNGPTSTTFSQHEDLRASQHKTTSWPATVPDMFNPSTSPPPLNITQRRPRKDHPFSPSPRAARVAPPIDPTNNVPEAVTAFANSSFGTNLHPFIIAHCADTQRFIDSQNLAWGTQYEIARGVSSGAWTWDDAKAHIQQLRGTNAESAFKVSGLIRRHHAAEPSDLGLWQELDREQAAIEENEQRGLGLMGEWQGVQDWYGGRIQQKARLVKDASGQLKVVLQPMEKRRSHRFARFYGSRRFLQLAISKELLRTDNQAILKFVTARFILCGRTYVPFHPKEGSLYMVETNEDFGRLPLRRFGDHLRLSFPQFINWHNPLTEKKNFSQVISKYVTRFALGLSNSVPALVFDEVNIHFIRDEAASDWPADDPKPPTDKLMTDGCGFINHAALMAVVKTLGYESLPAGVQGRLDGSKGFWILHPDDGSNQPKIWIRDSQNKIKNTSFDRAHRIFDLLCPSKPSGPTALSQQSILNVFSNSVPHTVLVQLMEKGLTDDVMPLLEWDAPHAMVFLWDAINKSGNVSGTRTQRLSASLNRALGLRGRDWGDQEDDEGENPDPDTEEIPKTSTGRNVYSGAPLGLHESAMELVQSGFHPSSCSLLYDKTNWIIQNLVKASVEKYHIPIDESVGAFVVPDPLGVLKEGEIFYRFSRARKDPETQMLYHVLTGDVVAGRYPIHLPSDMQKVTAVDIPALHKWSDVVIIPTCGLRSLANFLSGGDMDGDELILFWQRDITKSFQNKEFTHSPADLIPANFAAQGVETVEQFSKRFLGLIQQGDTIAAHEAFQDILVAQFAEDQKGLYSMFHDNAIAKYGYGHTETVRLAYIFGTLLDASKSGHRLKPGVFEKDRSRYGSKPNCVQGPNSLDILGILKAAGKKKGEELLAKHGSLPTSQLLDVDLRKPYANSSEYALKAFDEGTKIFSDELTKIRSHVYAAQALFNKAAATQKDKKPQGSPSKGRKPWGAKASQDDIMAAAAAKYAEPIPGLVLTRDVEQVKASCAYTLSTKFAFSVAFQQLCHIKASASTGGHAPTLRIFDEGKTFSSSFLRALKRCEDSQTRV